MNRMLVGAAAALWMLAGGAVAQPSLNGATAPTGGGESQGRLGCAWEYARIPAGWASRTYAVATQAYPVGTRFRIETQAGDETSTHYWTLVQEVLPREVVRVGTVRGRVTRCTVTVEANAN